LCVRVAGFLENAVEEIYGELIDHAASEPVARFAAKALGRIQNPKAGRFVEIAGSFKDSWASALESFLAENGRGEAIDSIMTNRHQVAHGGYSGITIARVANYLDKSVEVLELIENQCLGR
jgi:RiboL-PSP-HEPN